MENYNIYISTESAKYTFMDIVRAAGARITGVSGCGAGYYIQLDATPGQAETINREWEAAS